MSRIKQKIKYLIYGPEIVRESSSIDWGVFENSLLFPYDEQGGGTGNNAIVNLRPKRKLSDDPAVKILTKRTSGLFSEYALKEMKRVEDESHQVLLNLPKDISLTREDKRFYADLVTKMARNPEKTLVIKR